MNKPETFLADPASGIVSAYRFDADGKAEPLPTSAVDAEIASGEAWFWIHLSHADARCRQWVDLAPLSEIVREILVGDEEHQRLEVHGREIVGVIPDLQLEFNRPTEQLSRLRFAMSARLLVTMRRTPLRSVENVRRSIAAGTLYCSPMELLDSIIDHFGEVITQLSERVGKELDQAEERLWDNEAGGDESMSIARSRNQSVRVRRQLSQMRDLFHRLEQRVAAPLPEWSAPVQALAQKISAFDNSVAAIHDRARLLQEEMAARTADVTNRRLLTLSVLTATFLPPTLVTGFFGMNTKDLPFQNTDGGTWYAFAVAVLAGGLTYWIVSRLR